MNLRVLNVIVLKQWKNQYYYFSLIHLPSNVQIIKILERNKKVSIKQGKNKILVFKKKFDVIIKYLWNFYDKFKNS
jgi:hypothetical protein